MAVLLMFDSQAQRAHVEAITDSMRIRDSPPPGLICHVATETPEGVRIYDVWESEEDFQVFARDRLLPATRAYLLKRSLPTDVPLPTVTIVEAHDVVRGR